MKKIEHRGGLPPVLQVFAQQAQGVLSTQKGTEFWEASTVEEFEKNAEEIGYEIVPVLDGSTGRGYLSGFSTSDPIIVNRNDTYIQLKMYFIELDRKEFEEWNKKIKFHRDLQQKDMFERRSK